MTRAQRSKAGRVQRSGPFRSRGPETIRVRRAETSRVRRRGWTRPQARRPTRIRWSKATRRRGRPWSRVGGGPVVLLWMRRAEHLGRCRWGARRSRHHSRLRRLLGNGNPRWRRGRRPPALPWATGPHLPPPGTRNQIVHHSRHLATGSALNRRVAARVVPPSLPRRGPPLQVRPPPPRTGPPPTSAARRSHRAAHRTPPMAPPPALTARPLAEPNRPRRQRSTLPAGQMGHRLTARNRPSRRPLGPPTRPLTPPAQMGHESAVWNHPRCRPRPAGCDRMGRGVVGMHRPQGLHGAWRGLRSSTSTVQGVRRPGRIGLGGRPWMPVGGRTQRWTPPSTGRRARRHRWLGPGRRARRHPGRASGRQPTRAAARSAGPPTRRRRDPVSGPLVLRRPRWCRGSWTRRRRGPLRGP